MHLFTSIGASLHTLKSAGLNRKYISYENIFRVSGFATGLGSVNQFEGETENSVTNSEL